MVTLSLNDAKVRLTGHNVSSEALWGSSVCTRVEPATLDWHWFNLLHPKGPFFLTSFKNMGHFFIFRQTSTPTAKVVRSDEAWSKVLSVSKSRNLSQKMCCNVRPAPVFLSEHVHACVLSIHSVLSIAQSHIKGGNKFCILCWVTFNRSMCIWKQQQRKKGQVNFRGWDINSWLKPGDDASNRMINTEGSPDSRKILWSRNVPRGWVCFLLL